MGLLTEPSLLAGEPLAAGVAVAAAGPAAVQRPAN